MKALRLASIGLFFLGSTAFSAILTFEADLSGLNENPPNASPGIGFSQVVLDTTLHTLHIDVSFSGLVGTTTATHIHCCQVPPINAQVATQTPSFSGFPGGVTSGTYSNTFDLTLASTYNAAFITSHGGTVAQAETDLINGMLAGQSYLNIHTSAFGTGEIRGTLINEAPEPATFLLAGAVLLGLAAKRFRAA